MKIIPLRDDILVEPILTQAQVGLISRADQWQQDRTHAVVVKVGPGRVTRKGVRILPEVKPGQIVYIGKNPIEAKQVNDFDAKKKYLLVPESSLIAVLG